MIEWTVRVLGRSQKRPVNVRRHRVWVEGKNEGQIGVRKANKIKLIKVKRDGRETGENYRKVKYTMKER